MADIPPPLAVVLIGSTTGNPGVLLGLPVPVPPKYPTHFQGYGFYTGTGHGLPITCTRMYGYGFYALFDWLDND